jgi:TonB family protein
MLARPLSPGTVALLFEHAAEPSVRARWAEALKDSHPEIRAAAARVINVTGATGWIDELQAALAAENDRDAAEEEVLALGASTGAPADERLLAAATRLGGSIPRTLAETWARVRGIDALRSLAALRGAGLKSSDLKAFLILATRDGTENLTRAGITAVRESDAASWAVVLELARRAPANLEPGLIVAALGTASDAMHAATYWHLALLKSAGASLPGTSSTLVEEALKNEPPQDLAAGLALELLARALGRKPLEQSTWIAALGKTERRAAYSYELLMEPALLVHLTKAELGALLQTAHVDRETLQKVTGWAGQLKAVPQPAGAPPKSVIRSVDHFPRGFVESVLAVSGCRPAAAHGVGVAEISYGNDGRPRGIAFAPPEAKLGKPPECQDAARLLLTMSLASPERVATPEAKETVLVLLNPAALQCLAESDDDAPAPIGENAATRQHIEEPKRIKYVEPVYPEPARLAHVHGLVVLQALITPSGCVRSLEVDLSHRALTWAAMSAVSQWRYTPTRLNGVPVPVHMTVTTNFRLN